MEFFLNVFCVSTGNLEIGYAGFVGALVSDGLWTFTKFWNINMSQLHVLCTIWDLTRNFAASMHRKFGSAIFPIFSAYRSGDGVWTFSPWNSRSSAQAVVKIGQCFHFSSKRCRHTQWPTSPVDKLSDMQNTFILCVLLCLLIGSQSPKWPFSV